MCYNGTLWCDTHKQVDAERIKWDRDDDKNKIETPDTDWEIFVPWMLRTKYFYLDFLFKGETHSEFLGDLNAGKSTAAKMLQLD